MALRKYLDWRHWLRGIVTGFIQGGASGVLAALGLAGGYAAGADVKPLDLKQIGGVFIAAAIIHVLIFLKSNPFPPEAEETVDTFPPIAPK